MNLFYDQTATLIRWIYDRRIIGPPVLDLDPHFPAGERFAEAWRTIRDEAVAVAARLAEVPRFHEIMPEQTEISANDDRDWRMFIIKAYGVEVPENKARCPALAAIVATAPEVLSASISFMAPGKHIPAHRGPFRGVLRFYLALSMPRLADGRPGAVLKVADREYRLQDGDYMLWDDTYPHEAWNESDQLRAVLLLDVWRPGMPVDMELFSRALISIVRAGMRIRGFA
ncbi:MAG TPA: aspartyl/asparaginyl beta-hydroxylase domain-containing protein [Stellaceae bacterium]|nr:aspartyl/asparaginyl beta-hydroxylase domain-containing protein [Stellaceae bacterium]